MRKHLQSLLARFYGLGFNLIAYLSPGLAAKMAFQTFCKVRKGRVLPHQAGFLEKASSHKVDVNGHSIQSYHWQGSGDTVLLVHGWESNTFRWRNLIGHLQAGGFDIRAFDAPAHGHSSGKYLHVPLYSDCLLALIKKHRPKYVIAHSVGGMTALYTQYRQPNSSVEKLVTIGSPAEFHEILKHYKDLLGLNRRVMKALEDYIRRKFGFGVREFSSPAFVKNTRIQGLIIHDRLDTVAPFHASQQVHAHWDRSILYATEGLGHSMHQDEVNKKIMDFLVS